MNQKKKIVVGLSGGVDSSVVALLLKQQGHDVSAVFMQNWEVDNDDPYCTAEQDLSDARLVCDQIGIRLQVVNFAKEYWDQVFSYCLDEFNKGRTPNPDIYCNRDIKFRCLLDYALSLGADYLATGHYAKIAYDNNQYSLQRGVDPNKDQSYFLYTLDQTQLAHSLFPLGDYHKPEIRALAEQAGLATHNKKDSTGICFIGERNFKEFLSEFLLAKPGDIKTDQGQTIGRHDGLMFYTLGQRKGLDIGGRQDASDEPWYVVDKIIEDNSLIVGQGHLHPRLLSDALMCNESYWVNNQAPTQTIACVARHRYHQPDQACQLIPLGEGRFEVNFSEKQRAITPGQSIVFYDDQKCLGGAIIQSRHSY